MLHQGEKAKGRTQNKDKKNKNSDERPVGTGGVLIADGCIVLDSDSSVLQSQEQIQKENGDDADNQQRMPVLYEVNA